MLGAEVASFPSIQAQQMPYMGLFQENWVILNPAMLNHAQLEQKDNTLTINAWHRRQSLGIEGAPQQTNLRFEQIHTTSRDRSEINDPVMKWGLSLAKDQIAAFSTTSFSGNFAYIIELIPGTKISGGFNIGIFNQNIRLNQDQIKDWSNDQLLQNLTHQSRITLNADAGFLCRRMIFNNRRFYNWYFGFSATNLLKPVYNNLLGNSTIARNKPYWNVLFGCLLKPDDNYGNAYLEPTLWVRYFPTLTYITPLGSTPISLDVNLRLNLESQLWFAGGYGTSGNASVAFGYQFQGGTSKLKGGLMMNIPTIKSTNLGHSIEVSLGLALSH